MVGVYGFRSAAPRPSVPCQPRDTKGRRPKTVKEAVHGLERSYLGDLEKPFTDLDTSK